MPASPWRSFTAVDPARNYLVMASRLPLLSHRMVPRFLRLTLVVTRQLAQSPGLVGYSLLARPLARTFWTLSAWNDQASLMGFASAMPHLQIMQSLRPHMGPTAFTQWTVPGAELPVHWPDAIAQLDAVGARS